jgi:ubiquinone/menaquinone biosynthesis C-methylase UbiE
MTLAPKPQPFDPARYRSAAAHYEKGRVPYAPALIHRVAEVTGLGPAHRVLDLGCGPGPLARRFAPLVREVVGIDPNPEMLAEARALAANAANIQFVSGSSYDLGPPLGRFQLAVMGRSFHWMDRVDTLKRLDGIVDPAGAVALFQDTAPAIPANAWRKVWHDICERYEPKTGEHQGPDWIRHEAVLLASPFSRLERFGVIERRTIDVETIVQRTLSMGSTSPGHLGEKNTAAIMAEIRARLADVREEVVKTAALVAWRPN